jgi:hypothetical protein
MPVVHIFWPLISHPGTPLRVSGTALLLLLGRAEVAHHHHEREVADHRVLVLQVVVQAKALGGQVFADHRHPEVGAVLAAELLGQGGAQEAGLVRAALGLAQ